MQCDNLRFMKTKTFRYDTSGKWYKGNTHLHSTASDGGHDFKQLASLYRSAGYDFLFRTDHWVSSNVGDDDESYPLLWLDGIELDGRDSTGAFYHVVCLGRVAGVSREDGLMAGMEAAREQGALIIAAHPYWRGNSLEDCTRWQFDGVEVYNHICQWLNGKGYGMVHWDAVLQKNPDALAFAVDDAHLVPEHPVWNGGWIVVNAGAPTKKDIFNAIRAGNFFSSCGPDILSLELAGNELILKTSPVKFIRLVGPGANGKRTGSFDGPLLTDFRVSIPEEWQYVYVEVEDKHGRRAWTNNLFFANGS